jgi:hypothetical protein
MAWVLQSVGLPFSVREMFRSMTVRKLVADVLHVEAPGQSAAFAEAMETFRQTGADYFATSGCPHPASRRQGALPVHALWGIGRA